MSQFNDPPGQREELTPGDEQTPSRMLGWALAYAARGFLVHPLHTARAGHCSCGKRECSASGKHPRLPKWPSRATTESQEIRAWWTRWPEANIGLLTGARSGVIVLDIDPRNDGDASLASLEARYGKLPETPRVRTGGGGLHVYFAAPASEVSSGHPGSGLDLQGDGGRCVVLPPSLHRSGAEYRWVEGLSLDSVSLAPLPPWLLRPVGAGRAGTASKTHRPIERLETRGAASTSPWPESALRAECDAVAHAPAGTRNAALNKAAFNLGQLVPHLLEESRVESSLLAAAATCGLIEDDGEPAVRATLRSGLGSGMGEPREPHARGAAPTRAVGPRVGDAPAGTGPTTTRQLPVFVIQGQRIELVDAAINELASGDTPTVFLRAGELVRVVHAQRERQGGGRGRPGVPKIQRLTPDALRNVLARRIKWVRGNGGAEGEVFPPDWLVRSIMASARLPFPELESVVEAPTFRPDGSILDRPGYDAVTGLLYIPSRDFPRVPAEPTPAEIVRALETLLDPIRDFPFRESSDRAAAVAALLSIVSRYAIAGCVPLFAVRATAPGTGKSLLVDVISLIATGRRAPRMSHESEDAETRKRILAIALEAERIVLLDNVYGNLGSPALAAALTAEMWKDRLLGVSATAEAPLTTVWFATGNNMTFGKDLGRRVMNIDLDARLENPEDRPTGEFKHPDLCVHVERSRQSIIVAALTVLRGYHVAGRPPHAAGPKLGSFEAWDDLIRGACIWATLADPAGGRERIRREDDSDRAALSAALSACQQAFGRQAFTVAAAVRAADDNRALADALLDLSGRDRLEGRILGNALRVARGRIVDGLKFGTAGMDHKTTRWCVEEVS